jgi:hypothetical protein
LILQKQQKKWPVRQLPSSKYSPAEPDPSGLLCAPEPRVISLYRKFQNQTRMMNINLLIGGNKMYSKTNTRAWFVVVYVLLGCVSLAWGVGNYDGGDGSEGNPFQIRTAAQMDEIGQHPEDWIKYFILTDHINLSGYHCDYGIEYSGGKIRFVVNFNYDPQGVLVGGGPSPGLGRAIAVYDLEPDGLAFNAPVTITVTADVTDLNQNQRDRLKLYLYTDTDGDGMEDTFIAVENTVCNVVEDPTGTFIDICTAEKDFIPSAPKPLTVT